MESNPLPLSAPRISDEKQTEICRLDIRGLSQVEIAKRTNTHRNTVARVLERTRGAIAITTDLEPERQRAIAVYRELMREAWDCADEARGRGRSPAMLLAEIRQAQQRIDTLLGLAPAGPDDPTTQLLAFKQTVLTVIQSEAPEMAAVIAERLLATTTERAS